MEQRKLCEAVGREGAARKVGLAGSISGIGGTRSSYGKKEKGVRLKLVTQEGQLQRGCPPVPKRLG